MVQFGINVQIWNREVPKVGCSVRTALYKPTLEIIHEEEEISSDNGQSFRDKATEPGTSFSAEEFSDRRSKHSREQVILDIEDIVGNFPVHQDWTSLFNWDDFGYSLILGFAPTAWDVYSDLDIADQLTSSGDSISAGLSYLFICIPGLNMFNEVLTEKLSDCSNHIIAIIVHLSSGFILSSAMMYAFWTHPLLFRYPAIAIGISVVAIKGLAVFVHTPGMKKISTRITTCESMCEAPLQLFLLLHLWVSRKQLFLSPILSSLLIIAKVNAEISLSDEPADLMRGKSFLQKLLLILRYIPLFATTAFFRVSSGIIKHSGPNTIIVDGYPTPVPFSVLATFCFFYLLYLLTLTVVKLALPNMLADLTIMDLGRGITAEFTTVSNWGRLGRERSK